MGMIKLLTGLAMLALFAIAIISYSMQFGDDNNAFINLKDDPEYSNLKVDVDNDLSTFVRTANDSIGIAFQTTVKSGDQNIESGGQFKTGPGEVIGTTTKIFKSISKTLFGNDPTLPIVTTTIIVFVGFMGGLYIWRLLRSGEPD